MDISNNNTGVKIGNAYKYQENWQIAGVVQEYVYNGWLLQISNDQLAPTY